MKLGYFLAFGEVLTGLLAGLLLLVVGFASDVPTPLWLAVAVGVAYAVALREMWRHAWTLVRKGRGR